MRRLRKINGQSVPRLPRPSRCGSVQFELAMFLPLYAILLMSLLTLCSFTRTSQSTVIQARQNALLQQELTGTSTQPLAIRDATKLGQILRHSQPADGGLLVGNAQRSALSFLRFLEPGAESRYTHYVLTDPWDSRVLAFPDKSQHPPLQLDRRQAAFGEVNVMAFHQLIPGLSQATGAATQHLQAAVKHRQPAQRKLQQGTQAIRIQLQAEQLKLNSLQQQLTSARAAVPPQPNLINDLQRRITSTQTSIIQLKRQQMLARDGQNLLQQTKL